MTSIPPDYPFDLLAPLKKGVKGTDAFKIGIELEGFLVDAKKRLPVQYSSGVSQYLNDLADNFDWERHFEGQSLLSLSRLDEKVTLEPGSALEFVSLPQKNIYELALKVRRYYLELQKVCESKNYDFLFIGYQPFSTPEEIELIPKKRYGFMYEYMPKVGSLGREMMKLSAATQIAIDYSSESDAMRKLSLATKCTPLFLALSANSPLKHGAFSGRASVRGTLWGDTDAARCDIPSFALSATSNFNDYVEWALDVPMYFIHRAGKQISLGDRSFREFLNDAGSYGGATAEDWNSHLSTLFPRVRLRHYVEIRSFDCCTPSLQIAFAALIKGLFYSERSLRQLEEIVGGFGMVEINSLIERASLSGLEGKSGSFSIRDLCAQLLEVAKMGLQELGQAEEKYLIALEQRLNLWSLQEIASIIDNDVHSYLDSLVLSGLKNELENLI